MTHQKRLFLLDAYALIFRGYYAFIKNPRINSKGMDTSAIMGFMNSLLDIIKKEKPDHLAVAFDKGGSALRNEIFPEYKAHREETPDAIKIAVPYIQELLRAMHIPIIEMAGFEADDLIGTIAKQAEKVNYKVFMVTPDKDFAQLVSENIFMYKPARMGNGIEIWGIPEVLSRFEIERPEQVIDFLAMMGDAADNIPGLPGVGEVTAKKLLKEFGSIENLLSNTNKLKGKLKENIEANKEKGLLSKTLATILLDCPVTFNEENYILSSPDFEKTNDLFNELEFRRMAEQFQSIFNPNETKPSDVVEFKQKKDQVETLSLFSEEALTEPVKHYFDTLENTEHFYQIIEGQMGIRLLFDSLNSQKKVSFYVLSSGHSALSSELIGISFSYENHKGFYVPYSGSQEEKTLILKSFASFFENESVEKVGQNLKNSIKTLSKYGIVIKGKLFDTMIAHYLINPDMRHNLGVLSETYLKYSLSPLENLINKKNQQILMDIPTGDLKEYVAESADIILQLQNIFTEELIKTKTEKLFAEIEIPLVSVLADMETSGIRLDIDFLKSLSEELTHDIKTLETRIYELAGETFNLASPRQLGTILFDKLKIGGLKQKKTKTGQYATGEEVLSYFVEDHEIVAAILDWRSLIKLQNTYVEALPQQIDAITQKVHTDYFQTVAATGRLSSNNPNLQNIPIRTERGRQIRKAFVANDENYVLLSADYSQIELRVIAALSGEENMILAFQNNEDIHKSSASKIFNIPLDEVTREQRGQAKTVNFGIIYGVSAFGLSNQTSLSRSESKDLIDAYYETYPQLKSYIKKQIEFARNNGYVETIMHRRRYLKDINSPNAVVRSASERNAINAPIQGSAADIIKIAMIAIHNKLTLEKWKTKMLLQVHDELIFDVYLSELEDIKKVVKHEMENAFSFAVPLEVEMGVGKNWLEAH